MKLTKYLTMEEYYEFARKIICKYGIPSQVKDFEIVGLVAEHLMLADVRYDKAKSRGKSRENFRLSYGRYGISKICRLVKGRLSHDKQFKSLDWDIDAGHSPRASTGKHRTTVLRDYIKDKSVNVEDRAFVGEIVEYIKEMPSEAQRECLLGRFVENLKNKDIAERMGITESGVSFNIKNGLEHLQRKFSDEG